MYLLYKLAHNGELMDLQYSNLALCRQISIDEMLGHRNRLYQYDFGRLLHTHELICLRNILLEILNILLHTNLTVGHQRLA